MSMKNEKLFRAIGQVGDDLIAMADRPPVSANTAWRKWAALAACCVLVIGIAAMSLPQLIRNSGESAKSASAVMENAAAPAYPASEEYAEAMPESAPEMLLDDYAAESAPEESEQIVTEAAPEAAPESAVNHESQSSTGFDPGAADSFGEQTVTFNGIVYQQVLDTHPDYPESGIDNTMIGKALGILQTGETVYAVCTEPWTDCIVIFSDDQPVMFAPQICDGVPLQP